MDVWFRWPFLQERSYIRISLGYSYASRLLVIISLSLLSSSGRDIFLFIYLYIFSTLQHNYTFLHTLHKLHIGSDSFVTFTSFSCLSLFSHTFASQVWAFVRFTHSAHPLLRNWSLECSLFCFYFSCLSFVFTTLLSFFLASIPLGFAWIGFYVWVVAISNC